MGCAVIAVRKDAARCGMVQLLFYRRAAKAGTEGTGMHHIGFSFLNLAEKMKELEAGGVKIVTPMREGRLYRLAHAHGRASAAVAARILELRRANQVDYFVGRRV